MAHLVLISLTNIDAHLHSKSSLHAYLLLALLPITKFMHKTTQVRSLLQDQLVHQALNIVLAPLKTATSVGIMMSDPRGNLCYCFMPLVVWVADMPEESLLAGTGPKASPVTTATAKEFCDAYHHPPRTAENTITTIRTVCSQHSPMDYKDFLKAIKQFHLNGIVELCWMGWALSDPSFFLNPEVLHHFHWMFWDHDVQWCITVMGAAELDFRFSLIQTLIGYRSFSEGILKLKQVTGRDHHAVQHYIIATVAGSVPCQFLIAIHVLLNLRYLAQAPSFTTQSLKRIASALQEFHDNKEAIVHQGARANWQIPKFKLLQSVVPSIHQLGAVMQWSADVTQHAQIEEIKVPARSGNNQSYYSQIARHLDWLDKCFRFDLATYIEQCAMDQVNNDDGDSSGSDSDEQHEPDADNIDLSEYSTPTHQFPDYFFIFTSLLLGAKPSAPKPYWAFAMSMTSFHLATKPLLRLSVDEAATAYQLPDLEDAIIAFANRDVCFQGHSGIQKLQIWHKVCLQQLSYHGNIPLLPQTLLAIPPSTTDPYG